ncbi:hypothetical protein JRO89_XS03G0249900 [Xanthoceras sorbifolium]|uniref:Uncharacterized protein n=1 Tax=Xanthoceras sorbifolium TaxID=99658 RepID=A0ABQ8IBQ6_9ROSI|nr:hypothetical protein JRO89_XS03G0249900 [Xanthoceras sorbifolium]
MMMLTAAAKDEWVRAAMTDDSVVVELLVRLKQAQAQAQAAMPVAKSVAVAELRWGIRQPRSRSLSTMRCDGAGSQRGGKGGDSATSNSRRASPTTPLSWSGGGGGAVSPSATADAFEETSRHQTSSGARSKCHHVPSMRWRAMSGSMFSLTEERGFVSNDNPATLNLPAVRFRALLRSCVAGVSDVADEGIATNETTSNATKRSRKKKTFAELKEEEGLLLKEKIHLKKEIETLRATFKEHCAANVNLKRMKLDLGLHSAKNPSETASDETQKTISNQGELKKTCRFIIFSPPKGHGSSSAYDLYAQASRSQRAIHKCKYFNLRQVLQTLNLNFALQQQILWKGKRKVEISHENGYDGSLELVASSRRDT